jgi:hypothetical protein
MKTLVNLILQLSWPFSFGRSVKYFLKHRTQLQLKQTGWTLHLFESSTNVLQQKWKKLNTYGWFSIKNGHAFIDGMADPFLFIKQDELFLFFETEITHKKGEIWAAKIEGNQLKNPQKVIDESFHMSFPLVFEEKKIIYMLPESSEDQTVRLYQTTKFPFEWKLEKILYSGKPLADINFVVQDRTYYWFCYDFSVNKTRLFYSSALQEDWIEHPQSPFESNRNAGNIFKQNDQLFRPIQIEKENYGEGVELRCIQTLTKNHFEETTVVNPFLIKDKKYSLDGVHHFSFVEKDKSLSYIITDGLNNNIYKSFSV